MGKKLSEVKNEDIEEIQTVIDRILSKGSNTSYIENEKVEFDL